MVLLYQRTLQNVIQATGIGLHSGKRVSIKLRPAAVNTGIVFRRIDLDEPVDIPVKVSNVSDTLLSTTLSNEGQSISTVEHVLAALSGLGVDNVYIDIDAAEVPIMDGSSAPFIYLLQDAGIVAQQVPKRFVRVKKTIKIQHGEKWALLRPFKGFKLDFGIDYNHPAVNQSRQFYSLNLSEVPFSEISRARTFGFMRDIELMRSKGLGRGGSMDNAIVLDDYRVLNPEGLRYPDEFVKHKILDAVGDLYTLGYGLMGAYEAYKSGHALNNLLLCELLQQKNAWELVDAVDQVEIPLCYPDANGLLGA